MIWSKPFAGCGDGNAYDFVIFQEQLDKIVKS